ncbi:hypothetical protein BOS5A_210727 [Bosea sp. EC-HK365B]|nr:hypothetical protein BOSE7B_120588 [Bosea sp. 7B]CAD5275964.1 hypothetical protein BOSE21B_30323 [Bosea sp. 21B]VVT59936.1 hypothetical protein BOS5A_210727 [Bosea sp. EC-HK365B]VXC10795.1 hypothetical protein BOSE127_170227 [Bosea sp. 127]VXC73141.1 hypothetical protein BOSE125_40183 [Bosea sp. 125]
MRLTAWDTVVTETPAARATSLIVTIGCAQGWQGCRGGAARLSPWCDDTRWKTGNGAPTEPPAAAQRPLYGEDNHTKRLRKRFVSLERQGFGNLRVPNAPRLKR